MFMLEEFNDIVDQIVNFKVRNLQSLASLSDGKLLQLPKIVLYMQKNN